MFAKEDQAKKDAYDESDDESAISRTESELREVTKVETHCLSGITVKHRSSAEYVAAYLTTKILPCHLW